MNTETKEIKVSNEIEEETKALIILIPSLGYAYPISDSASFYSTR